MMTLRAFGLGLGAAVAFSTVAVLEAPVQAASIAGQTLSFVGSARLETPDATTSLLNFSSFSNTTAGTVTIADASANVFGAAGSSFSIGDLALTKTNATTWELTSGPANNWLTGLADGVGFTLEQFVLEQVSVNVGPANIPLYVAFVSGFFTPSGLGGNGALTAQGGLVFESGSSFSADITAVPTPALLPGLIGLGVAALRKREQAGAEDES